MSSMTPHRDPRKAHVGVRELHDHLSRYVREVADGGEIVVTMRGRPVAKLVAASVDDDPLAELRARGLVQEPGTSAGRRGGARVPAQGSVSDLVAEQRR
jgi:prevent-host-death family protein